MSAKFLLHHAGRGMTLSLLITGIIVHGLALWDLDIIINYFELLSTMHWLIAGVMLVTARTLKKEHNEIMFYGLVAGQMLLGFTIHVNGIISVVNRALQMEIFATLHWGIATALMIFTILVKPPREKTNTKKLTTPNTTRYAYHNRL